MLGSAQPEPQHGPRGGPPVEAPLTASHLALDLPTRPPSALADAWKFFALWVRAPLRIAAPVPSGPGLARAMVQCVPGGADRRVLELGGGTGAFTRALLESGVRPENLTVIEYHPGLHADLVRRFPDVAVLHADAARLARALGPPRAPRLQFEAVVSGLPLVTMPARTQFRLLKSAIDHLVPGGRFVQFTYGFRAPANGRVLAALGLKARPGKVVFVNLPPARVYCFEPVAPRPAVLEPAAAE